MAGGNAIEIKLEEKCFSVDAREADMDRIADTGALSMNNDVAEVFHESFCEAVAEPLHPLGGRRKFGGEQLDGFGKTDNASKILSAGAAAVFLRSASDLRGEFVAGADKSKPGAGRAMEFMAGKCHAGYSLGNMEWFFSKMLDSVDNERDITLVGDAGDGFDVGFNACDVVCRHENDQAGLRREGFFELMRLNSAPESGREIGDFSMGERRECLADSGMFDVGSDDVAAGSIKAADEKIKSLCAPGGEDELLRFDMEGMGDRVT